MTALGALALAGAFVAERSVAVRPLEPLAACAAMLAWAVVALAAPATGRPGDYGGYLPAAALVGLAAAFLILRRPRTPRLEARSVP